MAVTTILGPSAVSAEPAVLAVDDLTPAAEEKEEGWGVAVGLTNLTDDDLVIIAQRFEDVAGCEVSVDDGDLAAGEHRDITVDIPDECSPGEGFDAPLTVVAENADGREVTTRAITPEAPEASDAPWQWLLAFPASLAGGILLVGLLLRSWDHPDSSDRNGPSKVWERLKEGLPHLPKDWSFKDTWVTNITLAATVSTAFLGSSDVADVLLGDGADSTVALATVAAAIAVGMVGAAVLLLLATRTEKRELTAGGLVGAAALVFGAAFGQLVVVLACLDDFQLADVRGWAIWVWAVGAAALALLAVYTYRSIGQTLVEGVQPVPAAPPQHVTVTIRPASGPPEGYPEAAVLTSPGDDRPFAPLL